MEWPGICSNAGYKLVTKGEEKLESKALNLSYTLHPELISGHELLNYTHIRHLMGSRMTL